jgi:hypothetical protein
MKTHHTLALLAAGALLSACGDITDKTQDYGINSHHLSQMQAGIWVDPHGCDQWIIDDGAEGYMSARLDRYGKPVCSGIAPPTTVVGKFKNRVFDPL